jgi:uncharacterized phage protein gp47/JayE
MRDLDVGQLGIVVDDRDPQAIFDAMVTAVKVRNPAWIPHNAALETMLLEAFAVAAADWIYATNRTLGALVETVLALFGVPRDPGAPGTGTLTVTFDGTPDLTIAAGTEFVTDTGTTLLATTSTVITTATAAVSVEEAIPGAATALTVGTSLSPVAGLPRLSACTLTAPITGGRPAEDDQTYLARCATGLARVNTSLATARDFTAAALGDPRVGRATTINRWNPDTSSSSDGHITVALHGRGAALDTPTLTSIGTALSESALAILTVHTIGADLAAVDVTAGITIAAGYDEADTIAAATAVLTEWLSWANTGWGQTITPTAIETVLGNVPGVSTPLVTAPTGDVTHQPWQLPAAGTITIHT